MKWDIRYSPIQSARRNHRPNDIICGHEKVLLLRSTPAIKCLGGDHRSAVGINELHSNPSRLGSKQGRESGGHCARGRPLSSREEDSLFAAGEEKTTRITYGVPIFTVQYEKYAV